MSSGTNSADAKVQLRSQMKALRAAIPAAERQRLAFALADTVAEQLSFTPGAVVSGFLSIGDELDTAPLLAALHRRGARLALPVMRGKGKPLDFRAYAPGDDLDTVMWGIREPKPDRPILEPFVILVPLLAFDAQGWRLGYGGGFYDRTIRLARESRTVRAIGLAFDQQKVDWVPHLDYDEPLDGVLTPSGLTLCHQR